MTSGDADGVAERIRDWSQRLLQLDRRNQLLYFKPGRSAVTVSAADPDAFLDRLLRSGKGLQFDFVPPRRSGRRFSFGPASDPPESEGRSEQAIAGDIETDCPAPDLQRRLRNLQRRDREWEQEQGINVLYLTLGQLEWKDEEGVAAVSPLLLLPCDLERRSPAEPFRLRGGDDLVANSTLIYKLAALGIEIPDFDPTASADRQAPVDLYLGQVREAIAARPSWQVTGALALGAFAFTKLAMYEDIRRMALRGDYSNLIKALAGSAAVATRSGRDAGTIPAAGELKGGRLDELISTEHSVTVLPTDHSQLAAIEDARRGISMVIHGPPGTGKSQTIANLIAGLIADHKSVLFVSEKKAALDVVKSKLEDCHLGPFCLELHGDRSRKKNVYAQLAESLQVDRDWGADAPGFEALARERKYLNKVVRSLHARRSPLGISVYQVHGRYARVRSSRQIEFDAIPRADKLSPAWLDETLQAAERLSQREPEFAGHGSSRWLGLRRDLNRLDMTDRLRRAMGAALAAIDRFRAVACEAAEALDQEPAGKPCGVEPLVRRLRLLQRPVLAPRGWFDADAEQRLRRTAERRREAQQLRLGQAEALGELLRPPFADLDFAAMASASTPTPAVVAAAEAVLGPDWEAAILGDPDEVLARLAELAEMLAQIAAAAQDIARGLARPAPLTLAECGPVAELAARLSAAGPFPGRWLESGPLESLRAILADLLLVKSELDRESALLAADFDEGLVDRVDADMLGRFRTDHRDWFGAARWFRKSYEADEKTLRAFLRTPRFFLTLSFCEAAVSRALEVGRLRRAREELQRRLRGRLGSEAGEGLDPESLGTRLAALTGLLAELGHPDPGTAAALLGPDRDAERLQALTLAAGRMQAALERAAKIARDAGWPAHSGEIVRARKDNDQVQRFIRSMRQSCAQLIDERRIEPFSSLADVRALCERGSQYVELLCERRRALPELKRDFGAFVGEESTDWDGVGEALDWVGEVRGLLGDGRAGVDLPQIAGPDRDRDRYRRLADGLLAAQSGYRSDINVLAEMFELESANLGWRRWEEAAFEPLARWCGQIRDSAHEALDWYEYRESARRLNARLGPDSLEKIRAATATAAEVPGIVERSVLGSWLAQIYAQEPELEQFSRTDHESTRRRYQEIERAMPTAARARVRRRVLERYPGTGPLSGSGQLGVLSGELSKRRRQLPVRRLFARIPDLLQALKPCVLLSPRAVSQLLAADPVAGNRTRFDVVVFDEASQVMPEDALPAIDRADQLIVVGDRKQLPPTRFFERVGDDVDDDDFDAPDSLEGRESILDVMVGQLGSGLDERYLRVHYRSRCESLIGFSNHHFYAGRLLTFPNPNIAELGLRDEYLPGATYDSGGTRTNRGEADRVVDLAFEMLLDPARSGSIGIVALSRAQADLIDQLIELRRLGHRELDRHFDHRGQEPLFVKNVETVQGDERDHIILSIGYGPTVTGQIPNRFGPINAEGGERRLNVAISRARQTMTVVHSLLPHHIRSQSQGARLLRGFLEYVANPRTAFAAAVTGTGEPESPFEEAVLAALRGRGHQVDSQVGVSGYRIDLAIRSADGSGYDLAVECDGASYHSSPAARDRDWLRQQVLEGLGWNVHRIWSTSWIRDPEAELRALEKTLRQVRAGAAGRARFGPGAGGTEAVDRPAPPPSDGPVPEPAGGPSASGPVRAGSPGPAKRARYFAPYREFDVTAIPASARAPGDGPLKDLIVRIVALEWPIHSEVLARRIGAAQSAGPGSRRAAARIKPLLAELARKGKIRREGSGDNFWRPGNQEGRPTPRRDQSRTVDHVAADELKAGIALVARQVFGAPREELVNETARQFGWMRTGRKIRGRIESAIDEMVRQGRLRERGSSLAVPRKPGAGADPSMR